MSFGLNSGIFKPLPTLVEGVVFMYGGRFLLIFSSFLRFLRFIDGKNIWRCKSNGFANAPVFVDGFLNWDDWRWACERG